MGFPSCFSLAAFGHQVYIPKMKGGAVSSQSKEIGA